MHFQRNLDLMKWQFTSGNIFQQHGYRILIRLWEAVHCPADQRLPVEVVALVAQEPHLNLLLLMINIVKQVVDQMHIVVETMVFAMELVLRENHYNAVPEPRAEVEEAQEVEAREVEAREVEAQEAEAATLEVEAQEAEAATQEAREVVAVGAIYLVLINPVLTRRLVDKGVGRVLTVHQA